jgi:hypothetical protein
VSETTRSGSELQATRQTYAGLLLVALSTLMYEILLTRIFSVTTWYHFAFVAISLAMFGMTAGALIVYLLPERFPVEATRRTLARAGVAFPVVLLLSFLTQLSIPFRIHPSIVAIYAIVFTFAVIAVPFVLSGIIVCLALTRYPRSVGRLYAADLVGAAIGCVLLIYTLEVTDGPTAVVFVACLASLGGLFFARDLGVAWLTRTSAVVTLGLGLFAAGHTWLVWQQFPILRIIYVKAGFEGRPLYERWNSYSRVRVTGDPNRPEQPYMWGLSAAYRADRRINQLHMDIDVAAGTVMTRRTDDPLDTEHLRYDVTNVGYYIRPAADALVVGTGGGRDILSALVFGARSVTGVELNGNIIETTNDRFGDFTGHLDRDPRVRFVNDEARSWIARQDRRFDLIQISLIDTWAATAAGAFVLSENSLYTVESWALFLRRLTDRGLLSVSRWYFEDRPGEVYRLTSLASASLVEIGAADPRRHMVIVRNVRGAGGGTQPDGIGTILVSPAPFSDADLDRLEQVSRDLQYEIVLSPRVARDQTFATLASGRDLDAFTRSYPIDISAPTDDNPFFFHMLRLRSLFDLDLLRLGKSSHNMEAVFVLGALLATVILLTLACVAAPLAAGRHDLAGAGPLLTFFASIGLGFMLVETSQMQRLIVVLGHPTYGLSVVLFALLLASGIGSYLTHRVDPRRAAAAGRTRLAVLLALLVAFGAVTPAVARLTEGAATWVRIVLSVALLFPPGLFMGMAFPLGMRIAAAHSERLTPWLWGINGATSVTASVLAVAIALSSTISTAFWTGCVCYAVALAAYARATSRARQTVAVRQAQGAAPQPSL